MKLFVGLVAMAMMAIPSFAQKDAAERLNAATEDVKELFTASDKGVRSRITQTTSNGG